MVLIAIWVEEEKQWHVNLAFDPDMFFFNKMHTKLRPNKLQQIVKKKIFYQFLVPLYQLLVKLSVKLINYVIGLQITLIYTHCFMLFNLENILEIFDAYECVML